MTKVLREAIAKVEALPEAEQDRIARELIDYLDKLNALRAEVEIGIKQLNAGEGRELDIEDVIRKAREEHGRGV
jgi:signal transduction histidine kinase